MKVIRLKFAWFGIIVTCFCNYTARANVLDNWTTNQITTNSFGFHHVVYGNGIYVAVGEYSDYGGFYTSADGLNWKLQYSEPNSWGVTLNYSSGHFISVAPRSGFNAADVSADGTNWTTTIFVNVDYHFTPLAITYGNGLYVVCGSTNSIATIMTSPDGTTWTYRKASTNPGGPINSVTYGAGKFVAIGNNDGFEYTSTGPSAGTAWIQRTIPGGNQISYGNGLFFVPLTNNSILISTDGINWSLSNTSLTNYLDGVFFANGLFMGWSGAYLATSIDGNKWVQYSEPLPGYSLATDGTRLVTVAGVYTNSSSPNAYNGFIYTSDVLVGIRSTNASAHQLVLSGLVGRNYQIQSTDVLTNGSNNWRTNLILQLPDTPYVWTDATATNSKRFYRGVLLP